MMPWAASLAFAASLLLRSGYHSGEHALLTAPQRDRLRLPAASATAAVSGDGRYVAFVSYARLVTADVDDSADIYILDRQSGAVTLESVGADGRPLHGDSGHPRLNGDGRYLVFDTGVFTDTRGDPTVQIFFRDRSEGRTHQISLTPSGGMPNGRSSDAVISADGSIIVFSSSATDLVAGHDSNGPGLDIYLYDVTSATIRRISADSRGIHRAQGHSYAPAVSGTGQHVAFVSTADLVGPMGAPGHAPLLPPSRGLSHVYVRDLRTGLTTRVTERDARTPGNASSWAPAISADGGYVAFASVADNLVAGDRNRAADVFVHDRRTGTISLVSRSARRGAGNGASTNPAIAANGRIIAFQSEASDLTCAAKCEASQEDINLLPDVFLFDARTGHVQQISKGRHGGWMEESGGPAMDDDGTVIAFSSRHPIDDEDAGHDFDLYLAVPLPTS